MPAALQSTSLRLMYNLIETIFHRRADARTSELYRGLLSSVLDCFVRKLGALRAQVARIVRHVHCLLLCAFCEAMLVWFGCMLARPPICRAHSSLLTLCSPGRWRRARHRPLLRQSLAMARAPRWVGGWLWHMPNAWLMYLVAPLH